MANCVNLIEREMLQRGILQLTLNDPNKRNALSKAMLQQLRDAIIDLSNDDQVRVVILAANGPAFCAGHDLKEITAARTASDGGKAFFNTLMALCSDVMQSIVVSPKPFIARVSGVATAAGCQLVASCDLAIADEMAKFSTPGVHIGLFCSTPMVALSRNVSNKHAMEMLLTGDMIDANRAVDMGLINATKSSDQIEDATLEMAMKIASKSKATLATGKKAFYEQREMGLADAYEYASEVMVGNMLAADAREGIGAFIEKRAPKWVDE